MEYTQLGRTGLKVSRLCVGTMNFGPHTTEKDSFAIMDKALDQGINFFDTANVYGRKRGEGITEQIVGRWFAQSGGRREKVVIATKVYGHMGTWPNQSRLSALHIREAVAKELFDILRGSMSVKEGWDIWEIAPKLDFQSLRENYITESIFKMGEIVENLNTGLVGRIIRRGTNYLICVTESGQMFKSWIKDLREYTEVKMDRKMRLPGKPNTLVGTSGYFKYVADMTPGFEKGDKTNLQYGAKPYSGYNLSARDFINKYRKKSRK